MVLLKQATSHNVATLSKAHYAVYLQANGATIIISASNKKTIVNRYIHQTQLGTSDGTYYTQCKGNERQQAYYYIP